MRDDRRNYLIVGSFVLLFGVGLLAWLAVLSGRTGGTDDYFVVYESVMGLIPGTVVLNDGYQVGNVLDVEPLDEPGPKRYRVEIAVREGWPIPDDSLAEITVPGFLAAVVIDIRSGRSTQLLPPGSEIPAAPRGDVVSAVSAAAGSVGTVIEDLGPLLDALAADAPDILANLKSLSADLDQTGDQLNAILSPPNVDRITAILANLEDTTAEASSLTRSLHGTREEVDVLLVRANTLLEDDGEIMHAVDDLHASLEAVARHSDAIAYDLELMSHNLAEFTRQLRENPGVLLRGRESGEDPM